MGFFSKPSRPSAETPADDLRCSFCAKHRREVQKLVAGPSVHICDACIRLCKEIVDESDGALGPVDRARGAIAREIVALTGVVSSDVSRRLLGALLALAGDAAECRQVCAMAVSLGDEQLQLEALLKIPAGSVEAWDRINLSSMYSNRGDPERALAELAAVDRAAAPADARALLPLYEASMLLEAGRTEKADEACATAARVLQLLPTLDVEPSFRARLVRQATLIEAAALRIRGDGAGALAILRGLVVAKEADPHVWTLIHDIHAERGEETLAAEAREQAVAAGPLRGLAARRFGAAPHP